MKFFIITTLVFHVILSSDDYVIELHKREEKTSDHGKIRMDGPAELNDVIVQLDLASTQESFNSKGGPATPTTTNNKNEENVNGWIDGKIEDIRHEYWVYEENKKIISSQNGELHSQNSELEKFVTQENEPRMFPLFTTFYYEEPAAQIPQILYPLTEEEAIYLWMVSEPFRVTVQEAQDVKKDVTYCSNYDPSLKDACEAIRRGSVAIFTKVHRTHMETIMDWVTRKQGVAPEDYVVKLRADGSIQISQDEDIAVGQWDNGYVNDIWDHNRKDVGYVMNAANSINIPEICKLMGAKIGHEINKSIDDDAAASPAGTSFQSLAHEKLDNDFLREL